MILTLFLTLVWSCLICYAAWLGLGLDKKGK